MNAHHTAETVLPLTFLALRTVEKCREFQRLSPFSGLKLHVGPRDPRCPGHGLRFPEQPPGGCGGRWWRTVLCAKTLAAARGRGEGFRSVRRAHTLHLLALGESGVISGARAGALIDRPAEQCRWRRSVWLWIRETLRWVRARGRQPVWVASAREGAGRGKSPRPVLAQWRSRSGRLGLPLTPEVYTG